MRENICNGDDRPRECQNYQSEENRELKMRPKTERKSPLAKHSFGGKYVRR